VKLAVGDAVVNAAHGAGRVAARDQRTVLGVEQEVGPSLASPCLGAIDV
jgi:RNA polymerase-interacting CarD/CdnL/TRCF family regulator